MNSACCIPLLYIIKVFAQHIKPTVSRIIQFYNVYYNGPFAVIVYTAQLLLSPYLELRTCLLLPKPSNLQRDMKGRYHCALFLKLLQSREKVKYLFPCCKTVYMCVSVTVRESDILFLKIGHKLNIALQST